MREKLNLKDKLNFEKTDLTAPNIVLEKICDELKDETNGYISGVVKSYSGHITSYYTKTGFSAITAALGTGTTKVNIQDDLGKLGDTTQKYEFCLLTPSYSSYKFRLFFMEFGIGNYPVKIVLEEGIADKLLNDFDNNYITKCDSPADFKELVMDILSTEYIISIMQELINVAHIKESENLDVVKIDDIVSTEE